MKDFFIAVICFSVFASSWENLVSWVDDNWAIEVLVFSDKMWRFWSWVERAFWEDVVVSREVWSFRICFFVAF